MCGRRSGCRRLACVCSLWLLLLLSACQYRCPQLESAGLPAYVRDSLTWLYQRHYTWGTNLIVSADSVLLEYLPLKRAYGVLYKGERVVVAEVEVHPADSVDSVWVKLAHSQETQGWLRECDMMRSFVPADSISQAIHLFSDTHAAYFAVVLAVFSGVWLYRLVRRKRLQMPFLNDIDSLYPLLLCLLMAFCATMYETIQLFAPDTWKHFYFNPSLSPFHQPFVLAAFITGLWLFVVVLLAAIDDLFRQLAFPAALAYLLGLASCCIFCYVFFILTTSVYIGYAFLLGLVWLFVRRLRLSLQMPRYRCGACGHPLRGKGPCPRCGAFNE